MPLFSSAVSAASFSTPQTFSISFLVLTPFFAHGLSVVDHLFPQRPNKKDWLIAISFSKEL
ncbi:uncharacterized protein ASCRUDRAFT_77515 [Ascoidea rubescens DSM 1968]|uniref:Uncharacterized protein n=1 Tax=Ascoidea rubescens DSM 1968 TaxID=1344418 RepID=A0A1D2VBD7_9ASCO|nr:hypothetical protein ASCRUDRAFT_77515 [Ascoidea rubescens DSM 1968]ODV58767.1 hypothetical protein ASCRUDRAFT_77515 [Ascoidea rubescens DSM 1968]